MTPAAAMPISAAPKSSSAVDSDALDLAALLRTFNETTERLGETHMVLQQQVVQLKRELSEANARLRRSQELAALGEMAAGIAHEIRNPLACIQLYVQLLGDDVAEDAGASELCGKISTAVHRIDAIVRDVLHFSRETELRAEPTCVHAMMHEAARACEALAREHRVEIHIEPGRDRQLHVDASLMNMAMVNLLRNAIEACDEKQTDHPRVAFACTDARVRGQDGALHDRVVLRVRDNGPGLSESVIDRMFNPFFTTRATGTGLGLAIVHRIIDAHGGEVHAHNNERGGACFELVLPADVALGIGAQVKPDAAPNPGVIEVAGDMVASGGNRPGGNKVYSELTEV